MNDSQLGVVTVVTVVLLLGSVLGPFIANDITNTYWQKHLIEEKHAEWHIDSETGEVSFELISICPNCEEKK